MRRKGGEEGRRYIRRKRRARITMSGKNVRMWTGVMVC
jgi:hypothetical protein